MFARTVIGLFLAALSVAGFASTFVFGSALTKQCAVAPEVLAFLRFLIAGFAMMIYALASAPRRRQLVSPSRHDWITIAWLGPVGTAVMAWCVFMGCARVSAANASMADALTPIMIFAVAAIHARHIDSREILGLVLGFLGALLVIQVVSLKGLALSAYSLGDVFVLLAAATWGIYTVGGRDLIERLGSLAFTTWTMLAGALLLACILPFGNFAWPHTLNAWLMTLALGLVSTLLPFWTWNAAQNYLPMAVLGVTAYFTPVFAVALAIVFLKEPATLLQWLGTILIILSAICTTRSFKDETASSLPVKRPDAESQEHDIR